MRKWDFKRWEIVLIFFSLFLFITSGSLYLTDFPLRKYLFDLPDEEGGQRVGRVQSNDGPITREIRGQAEFKAIAKDAPLYNRDTVVSGPSSTAVLELEDGGTITLGPATMVKLTFKTQFSFDGVTHMTQVDVVSGDVTGKSKDARIVIAHDGQMIPLEKNSVTQIRVQPPKPSNPKPQAIVVAPTPRSSPKLPPSPVPVPPPIEAVAKPTPSPSPAIVRVVNASAEILSPRPGARLTVPPYSPAPQLAVDFEWKVRPSGALTTFTLRKVSDRKEIVSQAVSAPGNRGTLEVTLQEPGTYEWEIRDPDKRRKLAHATFSVEPQFIGIQTLEPLSDGKKISSNQTTGKLQKKVDVSLRWNPYGGVKRYSIWISTRPDLRNPFLSKTVENTEVVTNQARIFAGKVYYQVASKLANGFTVVSAPTAFLFDFLPPVLVLPKKGQTLSNKRTGSVVLMTWRKTHFTHGYQLEIARDSGFKSLFSSLTLKENYYILGKPAAGIYWWRVRALSDGLVSPPSQSGEFTVIP